MGSDDLQSPTARAFGAHIEATAPQGTALFLVVGRHGSPAAAVAELGGEVVVTRISSDRRVLAVLPLEQGLALGRRADIELAGPVTIDPERFERFRTLCAPAAGAGRK